MKKIKLGNSPKFIIVDDENFELFNKYKWLLNRGGYAQARINNKLRRIHTLLINSDSINVCDHINGNKLDNRKANLRLISRTQNNANRKPNKNSKLGTKGVCIDKNKVKKPYCAYICFDNKKQHIGYFATLKEAAEAYNQEAIKLWGKYALLNNIN